MKVFEYGSGGSTVFFARQAGQVFSVEHDPAWHGHVGQTLAAQQLTNCHYLLRVPQSVAGVAMVAEGKHAFIDEREWEYPGMSFETYVRSIDVHPDRTFDLVLVDGRARADCIAHAISKIRPGGYMMLDNSNDSRYEKILDTLSAYPRTDFFSIASGWPPKRWRTSAWRM